MDKDTTINNYNHSINIVERKNILVTGVKKIESFDNEEFLMESIMGIILLKGENLEIVKLDTHDGVVSIKGNINSMIYDDGKKKDGDTFLGKLFK